ncbi:MAG TPA: peptide-methionine (S)-S-oxide reductase MsrA [Gemmatimonadales bacterium]|nr:peptide-methionine (S)-S-oxide reductase MsrA [Gemmatimonadales bacterium]
MSRLPVLSLAGATLAIGFLPWHPAPKPASAAGDSVSVAVFAGGCFWGVEGVFEHLKGVVSATAGYAGGTVDRPSYEAVSSGTTGHAESVRVVFDPAVISYRQLLEVFFLVAHDPTELDRQGPDVGTQYRSIVFYRNDDQRDQANAYIAELNSTHRFAAAIVTEVVPLKAFFPAEAYHQRYMMRHPDQPYIVFNDSPKLVQLHRQFPSLYVDLRGE